MKMVLAKPLTLQSCLQQPCNLNYHLNVFFVYVSFYESLRLIQVCRIGLVSEYYLAVFFGTLMHFSIESSASIYLPCLVMRALQSSSAFCEYLGLGCVSDLNYLMPKNEQFVWSYLHLKNNCCQNYFTYLLDS